MGLEYRKKSGRLFAGSKLNVDGQGIYTVNNFLSSGATLTKNIKENIGKSLSELVSKTPIPNVNPTPTPTPTNTETPTPTPTPTITPTPSQTPCSCECPISDAILTTNTNVYIKGGTNKYIKFTAP